eukprot:944303-Amphidinium_carterae.1
MDAAVRSLRSADAWRSTCLAALCRPFVGGNNLRGNGLRLGCNLVGKRSVTECRLGPNRQRISDSCEAHFMHNVSKPLTRANLHSAFGCTPLWFLMAGQTSSLAQSWLRACTKGAPLSRSEPAWTWSRRYRVRVTPSMSNLSMDMFNTCQTEQHIAALSLKTCYVHCTHLSNNGVYDRQHGFRGYVGARIRNEPNT